VAQRAWIYKCRVAGGSGYSWTHGGWLTSRTRGAVESWGGSTWIKSPKSWANLAQAQRADLVFCHQTDQGGLVGLTVAASDGYPDNRRKDVCSLIDLGPDRVPFDQVISVEQIRREVGDLDAYGRGKAQHTFHKVERAHTQRLLQLCCELNPRQARSIRALARMKSKPVALNAADDRQLIDKTLKSAKRREIIVESFERKAKWAHLGRHRYGYRCMIPGCRFKLERENGERFIIVHHIQWLSERGSPNDQENLSVVCPNHHTALHYGSAELREYLEKQIRREQKRRPSAHMR
jgi:hypothetical protein